MKRKDFIAALKEADQGLLRAALPVEVAARLEQRLLRRPARSSGRTGYSWGLAALLACAAAVAILFVRARTPDPNVATHSPLMGWLDVRHASADLTTRVDAKHEGVIIERGRCILTDTSAGVSIENAGPVEVRRESGGTRLVRGQIAVRVQPRMGLPPVRLLVSHGAIEVVGTSFNVIQNDQRGQVNLQEGKIRFRSIKGTTVELEPGQSLDWPLPEPTDPQQASPEHIQAQQLEHRVAPVAVLDAGLHGSTPSIPGTVNAPGPAHPTVVERLEQIQGLRSRGQWARAAEELSSLLRGPLPGATRERLSYELGSIVTYQIHDATRACAIWREHQKTYPRGRYRAEVERAQRSLTCGD